VNHHPGWLVDYQDVFIFENDVQRDSFWFQFSRYRSWNRDQNGGLACEHTASFISNLIVYGYMSIFNQSLYTGTGEFWKAVYKE
jgi:hypothetical protein